MTDIVHTFCKYIRSWFYNFPDVANFSHLSDGMQPSIFTTPSELP